MADKKKFKFDVVIGNPPYQEQAKDTSDNPIYHLFMDEAYKVAERVSFITPARFLFNAGKTPKAWNQKMLDDEHLKVEYYEQDAARVFSNNLFEGGVAITYRDASVNFGAIGQFTAYAELNSILHKVTSRSEQSIETIIFLQSKFDLDELYKEHPECRALIGSNGKEKRLTTSIFDLLDGVFSKEQGSDSDLLILGLMKTKREYLYIPRKYIDETINVDKHKVFVPKSNGASGTLGSDSARIISTPEIGKPSMSCTQSFICIGAFDSFAEAEAAIKYIKSKFARVLLGVLKVTQDNPPEKWKYVPLQDFTPNSDIDWTKPAADIDRQLYKKYGLDEAEIEFIETHVKEMA
jgi:hypothetical protein